MIVENIAIATRNSNNKPCYDDVDYGDDGENDLIAILSMTYIQL
jgi:hypothetical protein